MKSIICLISLLIFSFVKNISAQTTFQKIYADTNAYSFAFHSLETSHGNYIVTGLKERYKRTDTIINCNPFDTTLFDTCYFAVNDDNVYCFMTDNNGDTLWTKEFADTTYNEMGRLAIENSSGFLLICNQNYLATKLIQIDTLGQKLWEKTYQIGSLPVFNEYTTDAQATVDGYIITGHVMRGNNKEDIFLFKININGDSVWLKYYGDSLRNEFPGTVKITSDLGFVVAGFSTTDNNGNFGDIQLFKTDSSGILLWYKIIGDTAMEDANYFDITSDGGFILIGEIANLPSLDRDIYLVRTNQNGDTLWTKRYGITTSNEYGRCVKQTYDHGYIITGDIPSAESIPLIKTDSIGNIAWTQGFNYSVYNIAGCGYVEQTSDSGFLLPGTLELITNNGRTDIFLIKTDAVGNATTIKEEAGPETIKLFPNPFQTTCTLEFPTQLKNAEVIIYDILGNEIVRKYFTGNRMEIEKGNLESGVYFVRVRDNERQYVKRIVVQ